MSDREEAVLDMQDLDNVDAAASVMRDLGGRLAPGAPQLGT